MDGEVLLELTEMLLKFLKEVGGTLATQAFQITAQKVLFDGIFAAVVGIIFFLFFLLCLFWMTRAVKKKEGDELGFSIFFSILCFVGSIFPLHFGLSRIIATEYYTVLLIVNLIK